MKMPTAVVRRRVLPWKPGDPITFPPGEESLFSAEAGERLPAVAANANGTGNANGGATTTTSTTTTTGVTANGLFPRSAELQHAASHRPPSSSRQSKDKTPPLVVMTSSAPPSGQGDRKRFPILGPTRQDTELYFRRRRSARNRIRPQSRQAVTRSVDRVVPADCSPIRLTYSTDPSSSASFSTVITPSSSSSSAAAAAANNNNNTNNEPARSFYLAGEDIASAATISNNGHDRDPDAWLRKGNSDASRSAASAFASAATTTTTTGVLPSFERRGSKSAGSGLKIAATSAGTGSSSLPMVELPFAWNSGQGETSAAATTAAATASNGSGTSGYHLPHFLRAETSGAVTARTSLPLFDRSHTFNAGSGSGGGEGGADSGGQLSMVRSGGGMKKLEIPIKFLSESGQVRASELTHRILHKQQQQQQQGPSKQAEKTLQPSKHGFHRRSKSPTFKRLVEAVEKLQAVSAESDSDSYNTDTCNACTGRGSPTAIRLPAVPGTAAVGGGEGCDEDDGEGGEGREDKAGEESAYLHQHGFLSSVQHSKYRTQNYVYQYQQNHRSHQQNHHHHHHHGGVKKSHSKHTCTRHVNHQTLKPKRHSFHAMPAHGPSRKGERAAPPSNSCSASPPALGDPPVYLLGPGDRFYDDDDDDEENDNGRGRVVRGGGGGDARSTSTTHPDLTNGWGAWEVDSSLSVDSCLDPCKMNFPVGLAPADAHTELHLFLPRLADTPSEDGTANSATATAPRSPSKSSVPVPVPASAPSHQHRSKAAATENRASSSSNVVLAHRGKPAPHVHPHTSHRPPHHPSGGVHAQTQTYGQGPSQTSHSGGGGGGGGSGSGGGGGERHGRSQTAKRFTSPVRGPSKRDRTPSKRRAPPPPSDVYEMYEPFIKGEHLKEKMEDFPTLISLDQD